MTITDFYDQMSPFYHLIYPNWEHSIKWQAANLDKLIREYWGQQVETVLDVSCGVGTQTLGLAQLGYQVAASDLSGGAIERAKQEARQRDLAIEFSTADMREAFTHHRRQFDMVISCDNAVPHLLTDADILTAFRQFYACLRPGGGCLISVRDYDQVEHHGVQVRPYGLQVENGTKYLIFQVWEFEGDIYEVSMYFITDDGGAECTTPVMRTKYYAVSTETLLQLMRQAGFVGVERLDDRFYQPVIVGRK